MKGGRKVAKVMFNIVEFSLERFIWIYLVREVGGSLEIAGLALNKLPGLEDEIGKMIRELGDQK